MSKIDALTKKMQSIAVALKDAVEQIQTECNRQDERITDLEARVKMLEEAARN